MSKHPASTWDPASEEFIREPLAAYDRLREQCPAAYSERLHWTLFRHEDVMRALLDHKTFSNAVSQHLAVPSGMDQPEHTEYRRILDPYFSQERMKTFEPVCRGIATRLVLSLSARHEVDFIADVALPFAVEAQCAFLGWPPILHERLMRWTRRNHEATLAQDRKAMSEIAREFEGMIDDVMEARRQAGVGPETDVTAALMHEKVWGRPLSNEELASILRNWTVGEIGTIAAAIGILAQSLATTPELQDQLRRDPALIPNAIREMLRVHGPLVINRRITTCPVEVGGRRFNAGERISINWIAANRDGRVFEDPDKIRIDRDPAPNLLYGAGIHFCPGAPLANLEMRVVLEELFNHTTQIQLVPNIPPVNAIYPAGGFSTLPLHIELVTAP
ncbi:MAG: cytochrome P450 [Gammaproteobacteria bacterium]|nr:cytochrome P450 [Gammaproteobacteria bacterium]